MFLKIFDIWLLGKRSDETDEDLKGQISKGVANYVSAYVGFNITCICETCWHVVSVNYSFIIIMWLLPVVILLFLGWFSCCCLREYLKLEKQVRKVLWTQKAPTCLHTVLYVYDKPHLCMNIHYYAVYARRLTLTGRLQCMLHYLHCAHVPAV